MSEPEPGWYREVAAHESERQRVNRELLELLGELRVALPGVQVPVGTAPPQLPHCRQGRIVFLSNTLTVWGLLVLALAMTGVMLLIGDGLFSRVAAVLIAGLAGAVFALFWWVLPVAERWRSGPDYGPNSRGIPDDRGPEPTYRRQP